MSQTPAAAAPATPAATMPRSNAGDGDSAMSQTPKVIQPVNKYSIPPRQRPPSTSTSKVLVLTPHRRGSPTHAERDPPPPPHHAGGGHALGGGAFPSYLPLPPLFRDVVDVVSASATLEDGDRYSQFTCFTSTKVQILTQKRYAVLKRRRRRGRISIYLLY
jgi:hypothetical protein